MNVLPENINIIDETDVSSKHEYSSVMIDSTGIVLYRQDRYYGEGMGENWKDDPVYYAYNTEVWKEIFDNMHNAEKAKVSACCGKEWDGVVSATNIDDYIAYFGLDAMHDRLPLCTMSELLKREIVTYSGTTMCKDGYPTEEYLAYIKSFDPYRYDVNDFLSTLEDAWRYGDRGYKIEGDKLVLSTGGWSGNEEIINAIQESMFHLLYWESSHRGGRHEYCLKQEHTNKIEARNDE